MGYPKAEGLPELRGAIAGWCGRRFGVELDPDTEVIPTYGSKEAIFSFAQLVLDRDEPKTRVVVTEPGYPVPARGAAFAGARVESLPLHEWNGFLRTSTRWTTGHRIALFWVNYPNNPTGATAPLAFYERLAGLAAEHDFLALLGRGVQRAVVRPSRRARRSSSPTARTSPSSKHSPSARR